MQFILLRSSIARYGFAVAMVIASLLLRYAMTPLLGSGYTYAAVFPLIIVVAIFAGRWPAVLYAVLAGSLTTYLFATPLTLYP